MQIVKIPRCKRHINDFTTVSHSTQVSLPYALDASKFEGVTCTAALLIGGIPRTGHISGYMLDVLHWLPFQQRIVFRIAACPGLEVSVGPCPGLPARPLLSHPGNQRSQLPPLNETGVTLCTFCLYCHKPGPRILDGWPLRVPLALQLLPM